MREGLTDLLSDFIKRYEFEQGVELERLTVHVFKKTGPKELKAAQRAIGDRNIAFALVHVNRHSPMWLVELDDDEVAVAPPGTVVALGEYDRLLMTGDITKRRRNMHPLRLRVDPRSTFLDMNRIVAQVYGFTATSLRGFGRINEPSSILYGRLLAEKVGQLMPYGFQPHVAPIIGGKPWFL
jgi:hypothetical protein